jgi:hypothetical protein
MSQTKAQKAAAKAAKAVASAYKASLTAGNYANSPSVKAVALRMERDMNEAALDALGGVVMRRPKKRWSLNKSEKSARKRVRAAYFGTNPARSARLGVKKKRSGKKKASKKTRGASAAVKAAARRASSPKPPKKPKKPTLKNVTADGIIKAAALAATQRWLCEGKRRSGCGAGGSRVVTGKGSFVRIRPPRLISA